MFQQMGQTPSKTSGLVPLDLSSSSVLWRGRLWHFAGAEDNPPAGDPPPTEIPPVTPLAAGQEPATFPAEYVAELRREAAKNRKAAADAEAKLKAQDDAKLSETERLTKRATELEAQLASANAAHDAALIRAAVEREAHAQGAVKAEVVYRLVDRSAITLDESGDVKGADKAVAALLKDEPYLKATAAGTAPINGPPRQNGAAPNQQDLIEKTKEELRASGRYARF